MKQEPSSGVLEKPMLKDYQVGDFFLSSPNQTILGKGSMITVPINEEQDNQMEGLTDRVAATLKYAEKQGHCNPIVTGAIPFDYKKPAHLHVPQTVHMSACLQEYEVGKTVDTDRPPAYEIQFVPEPAQYIEGVEKGLAQIASGHLDKIVLARSLHLTSSANVGIHQLLHNLAAQNTKGYTFAVDLNKEGKSIRDKSLIGASPELLVSRNGLRVVANPLAGSRPRSDDPVEDQRRSKELLSSSKDLHEHAVVVNAVAEALRPFMKKIEVPDSPSLISTETMWHLSTEVKGELALPETSSLELAIALHPTPAVCGSPAERARESILDIESFDRGFFTGMVGWCNALGDGEWVVTIRCAEVEENELRLFAGAGVVGESKPEEELAETTAKLQTMLRAMGITELSK
ncbi:isochorismate synthase DhbC [Peribacillus psychrosaccharolyticus]|uniref:isochorismate synthase n=1 Tax=Peribacillus psychrosaccharolyticus TaxID=1407 RepID=A0A974NJ40_PERPY|nr:isochorismate synthase DhbC [Peribacillus psychrosaccharolyticus]MEC2057853.1 isochorismate synthase DhbC [Peribacillus psychrosaccharolyticus]MED3744544.1 isochorismate synthase DhbC [Peribacillus psychrosaccharolyticus]QQS98667.1 isochorismate synthase DhbC [Peribacillus psychrosaccharolyticus]